MIKTSDLQLDEPIVTGNTKAAIKAAGGGSSDLWTVPPSALHCDPTDNVRPVDWDRVRRIADNMKIRGYDRKEPLGGIVRKVDSEDRIYVYIGQHRYHAVMLAVSEGADISRVPIIIDEAKSVSRTSLIIAGVLSNDGENLTPLELAGAIADLRREGLDQATICKQLSITDQTVRDCALLESAPAGIHELVRTKVIAGTLAIQEIRRHGGEKALERLTSAATEAKASGKAKVTKKALAKSATDKISVAQAKQLLQTLRAVRTDPSFGLLDMATTTLVVGLLDDFDDEVLTLANEPATSTNTVMPWDTLKCTAKGVVAEIQIGRCGEGRFIVASTARIGTGGFAEPLKYSAVEGGDYFSTPAQAIAAGIVRIQTFARKPENQSAKHVTAVNRWLDSLIKGDSEVEKYVILQSSIGNKRAARHHAADREAS